MKLGRIGPDEIFHRFLTPKLERAGTRGAPSGWPNDTASQTDSTLCAISHVQTARRGLAWPCGACDVRRPFLT